MKQIVKVADINKKSIIASCDKTACESCKGNFFCSSKKTEFEVNNPKKLEIKKGDTIEINIPSGKTIFTSFISFAMPLIFFFAGLITAYFIWKDNQIMQFLLGFIMLCIAFAINAIYFKIYRHKYCPDIDKVIND